MQKSQKKCKQKFAHVVYIPVICLNKTVKQMSNTTGFTTLIGTIKVEGINGEIYSIDHIDMSNGFSVTSSKGYQNETPTLDKAIKLVRTRIKVDSLESKIA